MLTEFNFSTIYFLKNIESFYSTSGGDGGREVKTVKVTRGQLGVEEIAYQL